ncbi:MAG: hypothetical protein CSA96_02670 [Bacteroidetes bacterium]|nr:MAG: hypothetical protein CSA96_02670 [Bacteroidota bacterium]
MPDTAKVIQYRGVINFETMDMVLNQLRDNPVFYEMPKPVRKRLYSALAESMDNIFKYAARSEELESQDIGMPQVAVERDGDRFSIVAGNMILNDQIDELQFKLDRVNQLDLEALKSLYEDVITRETKASDRGAGLGLITMAMRTDHDINYRFESIDEDHSFFSMQIIIKG